MGHRGVDTRTLRKGNGKTVRVRFSGQEKDSVAATSCGYTNKLSGSVMERGSGELLGGLLG